MGPGERAGRAAHAGARRAVRDWGRVVMQGAQRNVGFETGELHDSAERELLLGHAYPAPRITEEVRFTAPYAAAQHEGEMTYEQDGETYHWVVRNRPHGGENKYLENQLKASVVIAESLVATRVHAELERRFA